MAEQPLDPTPMGTPVPAGECPHCGGFLWISLRAHAPVALPAGPGAIAAPPSGCCACPQCGKQIFLSLGRLPARATPVSSSTALIPKGTTTRKLRPS